MYNLDRDKIMQALTQLNDIMDNVLKHKDEVSQLDPQILDIRVKTLKQVIMEVDNSMGDLRDLLDTLEYHQDERYEEASRLVNVLEDNTTAVIEYLRSLGRY